jgi:hypothetical protein
MEAFLALRKKAIINSLENHIVRISKSREGLDEESYRNKIMQTRNIPRDVVIDELNEQFIKNIAELDKYKNFHISEFIIELWLADQTEDWDAFENLLYNNGKFNIEEIIHGIVCFRFAANLRHWIWDKTNFFTNLHRILPRDSWQRDYDFTKKIENKFEEHGISDWNGICDWNFRYQFRFAALIKEYVVYNNSFIELQKSMCYNNAEALSKEKKELLFHYWSKCLKKILLTIANIIINDDDSDEEQKTLTPIKRRELKLFEVKMNKFLHQQLLQISYAALQDELKERIEVMIEKAHIYFSDSKERKIFMKQEGHRCLMDPFCGHLLDMLERNLLSWYSNKLASL